jgi:uncharacterized membrane protein
METDKKIPDTSATTALVHYYRGEVQKMNTWRQRLDVTTNWAIVTSAGFLSFSFGSHDATHFVIVIATIIATFFLVIEARRYRYFDLWRWRVDLMNENFFAVMLDRDKHPLAADWREQLSEDLRQPRFKISSWEAIGKRLRRNYSWLFVALAICWTTKVLIHPMPAENFNELLDRAAIYHLVPGWIVITAGIVFNLFLFIVALSTRSKKLIL